jgi:hypothetical protein
MTSEQASRGLAFFQRRFTLLPDRKLQPAIPAGIAGFFVFKRPQFDNPPFST